MAKPLYHTAINIGVQTYDRLQALRRAANERGEPFSLRAFVEQAIIAALDVRDAEDRQRDARQG